jgi:hypothetical protein
MSITEKLDALIADLQAVRPDAEKVDKGKTGAPGTRLRKVAGTTQRGLKDLRAAVLEVRKAKSEV